MLCNKYLHARIYAEVVDEHNNCMHMITFILKNRTKISEEEYELFLDFYEEYAWIIKKEKFTVWFNTTETDIDTLKTFLEKIVDINYHLSDEDEIIIGYPKKELNTKK